MARIHQTLLASNDTSVRLRQLHPADNVSIKIFLHIGREAQTVPNPVKESFILLRAEVKMAIDRLIR
jgi:hypothetical protein